MKDLIEFLEKLFKQTQKIAVISLINILYFGREWVIFWWYTYHDTIELCGQLCIMKEEAGVGWVWGEGMHAMSILPKGTCEV